MVSDPRDLRVATQVQTNYLVLENLIPLSFCQVTCVVCRCACYALSRAEKGSAASRRFFLSSFNASTPRYPRLPERNHSHGNVTIS